MGKQDISNQLKKLRSQGHVVYSISRLNSFNQCQREYYYTYVKINTCLDCGYVDPGIIKICPKCSSTHIAANRGKDSIYGLMGGSMHDSLQNICDGVGTYEEMRTKYRHDLAKYTLLGVQFPSESIGASWKKDMEHFVEHFKVPYTTVATERGFVTEIENVYVQGFIDAMVPGGKGVDIIDWKTSSKFDKKKLLHAGRQLVLYKLAVEKEYGIPVNEVMWSMLKYVYVHYDGKVKMCNRGKWVKEVSALIKTQLKKLGVADFMIPVLIDQAIEKNTLDVLPKEVQDRFVLEDCVVKYEVTDELIAETKAYIADTVAEITARDEAIESYACCDLEKEHFFCKTLCGHSETCEAFKEWSAVHKKQLEKKW